MDNEGQSDLTCNNARSISIGYFPWETLSVDALKDAAGNCLFYAVSPAYKIAPDDMLNEDTNGMIKILDNSGNIIKGATPGDRPVAIIIASQAGVAGQNKIKDDTTICGGDYTGATVNLAAYLDNDGITDNANPAIANNVIAQFANASPTSIDAPNPVNDTIVTLSREEIWDHVVKRSDFNAKMDYLTHALAICLRNYATTDMGNRRLPWPAPTGLPGSDYTTQIIIMMMSDRCAFRWQIPLYCR